MASDMLCCPGGTDRIDCERTGPGPGAAASADLFVRGPRELSSSKVIALAFQRQPPPERWRRTSRLPRTGESAARGFSVLEVLTGNDVVEARPLSTLHSEHRVRVTMPAHDTPLWLRVAYGSGGTNVPPFALVTVWCPESLGANLSRADVERSSFLEQLPIVIGGATQSIGAEVAGAEVAHSLDVPVGSPLLVARRITRSADGTPVLVSRHVFAAHRTEFVVDLPAADDTLGPSGLRLVD